MKKIEKSPMSQAIRLARKAELLGEIPVGCVIVNAENKIVSSAFNLIEKNQDPTAHAEILAIRRACKKLKKKKLYKTELYVTLEPCRMCEAAIINAGISKVYFGAYSASIDTQKRKLKNFFSKHKQYEFLGGIEEEKCQNLITSFFKKLRK